jgi:hypothetical protein
MYQKYDAAYVSQFQFLKKETIFVDYFYGNLQFVLWEATQLL